ncbi:MAG: RCC1 domain-containing protein, partial [Candidatus Methylumidiphilus sp.]
QELSVSQVDRAHVLIRTSDGKLHVCGNNNLGQLGLGDTVQRNILTTVSGKTVTAVQACGLFDGATYQNWSQIILTSGSLQSAGGNVNGQLGNNTTTDSNTFINTTLNHTNVVTLVRNVGGYTTSGYITSAGILWLCGHNAVGTLGNGSTTQSNVYVQPSGSFQGFVSKAIIAGTQAIGTCVLMTTSGLGEVWATGGNSSGQCGDGSTTTRTTFGRVPMPELIADISAAATSILLVASCFYALSASGRVYSWGANVSGQAGQGHLQAVYVPNEVLIR